MKVIFFGTPEYTLPILGVLYKEYGRGGDAAAKAGWKKKENDPLPD
jgi:methionyl-tRNA formyltransferase